MNRREALVLIAAGFTGTIFGARRMLAGVVGETESTPGGILADADRVLLNEVGETILPATPASGGAKAANVAAFMEDMVGNFYDRKEQATFTAGLVQIQAASRSRFSGRGFLELAAAERHDLVMGFEETRPQPEFYRMIKQLAVWGYFTSEVGATQAMAHVAVPGRFDGIVTIPAGTRAWSD
jgi:Gluconate 2-dehydrogenase subunit 3